MLQLINLPHPLYTHHYHPKSTLGGVFSMGVDKRNIYALL